MAILLLLPMEDFWRQAAVFQPNDTKTAGKYRLPPLNPTQVWNKLDQRFQFYRPSNTVPPATLLAEGEMAPLSQMSEQQRMAALCKNCQAGNL